MLKPSSHFKMFSKAGKGLNRLEGRQTRDAMRRSSAFGSLQKMTAHITGLSQKAPSPREAGVPASTKQNCLHVEGRLEGSISQAPLGCKSHQGAQSRGPPGLSFWDSHSIPLADASSGNSSAGPPSSLPQPQPQPQAQAQAQSHLPIPATNLSDPDCSVYLASSSGSPAAD